jgi:hypothetical protein
MCADELEKLLHAGWCRVRRSAVRAGDPQADATQYAQPYDILGALAQMQPMPPAPQFVADPNYIWARQIVDGQVVAVVPGDLDLKKHDQLVMPGQQ